MSVRPQDYGQYKCKVKNLEGQVVELSAWLKKKKKDENVDEGEDKEIGSLIIIIIINFFSSLSRHSSVCDFIWKNSHRHLRILRHRFIPFFFCCCIHDNFPVFRFPF